MKKTTNPSNLSSFALTTLGAWHRGAARVVACYYDEATVRINVDGRFRVLTEREWFQMWDNLRDAGYTRAA